MRKIQLRLTSIPSTHLSVNATDASPSSLIDLSTFATIIGLKTLSSKCPLDPPTVTATWLPMTWAAAMVIASHCVGLTFPGMMEEPGSFSGRDSSPRPQRGPEARNLRSLAIFMSEHAMTLSAPDTSTMASWAARASNLLGAVTKGRPVREDTLEATFSAKPTRVLRPVPTAVPPAARRYSLQTKKGMA